ncbi:MAG: SAM-dependent methyltransferase, partial [Glaciihabitans sp.]|nr:SAM-dependent methyltransferase [Glaciihabitans sp.]
MNTLRLDRAGLVSLGREPGNAFAGAIDPHTGDMPATVDEALQCAFRLGEAGAVPGTGYTRELWETLASLAAHDLGAARTVEPHLDAIAILAQAGATPLPRVAGRSDCSWGVFAAEGGPDPLVAVPTETSTHNQTGTETTTGWMLVGSKPWCSLAGRLTAALVSATTADGERRLFAVDLAHHGVTVEDAGWQARGLTEIPSGPVRFDSVPVFPVGDAGWYLQRPGFSWGGIGVAACWYGGAVGLARTLFESFAAPSSAASSTTASSSNASSAAPPDRLALMHLGAIDEQLHVSRL